MEPSALADLGTSDIRHTIGNTELHPDTLSANRTSATLGPWSCSSPDAQQVEYCEPPSSPHHDKPPVIPTAPQPHLLHSPQLESTASATAHLGRRTPSHQKPHLHPPPISSAPPVLDHSAATPSIPLPTTPVGFLLPHSHKPASPDNGAACPVVSASGSGIDVLALLGKLPHQSDTPPARYSHLSQPHPQFPHC